MNSAYQIIIEELKGRLDEDEEDLGIVYLIRLMGQTGVCVAQLEDHTMKGLIDVCVRALQVRDFVDVLLPWVHAIVIVSGGKSKKQGNKIIGLTQLSNLVECLLALLNDPEGAFVRELEKSQRAEVHKIYKELEGRFCS